MTVTRALATALVVMMSWPAFADWREEAWIRKMEEGVRQRLKDPYSAKFRGSSMYTGGPARVVCGEVNAKNSFGGYTGFEGFVAAGDVIVLASDMKNQAEFADLWRQACR